MKVGVYLERRHDVTWTTRALGISETTEAWSTPAFSTKDDYGRGRTSTPTEKW